MPPTVSASLVSRSIRRAATATLAPLLGGADRDRVADAGGGADHEEAQAGDIGGSTIHCSLPFHPGC